MPVYCYSITGTELRGHRKAAGLTQAELARRAGFARDAVQYWEAKDSVPLRYGAPAAFAEVLGLPENAGFPAMYARAGGWGDSRDAAWDARLDSLIAAELSRLKQRAARRMARHRCICGAKTRKGTPCRNKSEPGRRHCKFHGGKSTGATTPEGRARIAEAQRRRWAKWRAGLEDGREG